LIIINPEAKNDIEKLYILLAKLDQSSEIKVTYDSTLNNGYCNLLKDFGIFIEKKGNIQSRTGIFTAANITKLNHSKYIFSMLTDEFFITQDDDFIEKYFTLFHKAWNDSLLFTIPLNSLISMIDVKGGASENGF